MKHPPVVINSIELDYPNKLKPLIAPAMKRSAKILTNVRSVMTRTRSPCCFRVESWSQRAPTYFCGSRH